MDDRRQKIEDRRKKPDTINVGPCCDGLVKVHQTLYGDGANVGVAAMANECYDYMTNQKTEIKTAKRLLWAIVSLLSILNVENVIKFVKSLIK